MNFHGRATIHTGIPHEIDILATRCMLRPVVYTWAGESIAPGAGCFLKSHERLVLTNPNGSGVTDWRLPQCFYPDNGKCPLTYHRNPDRWKHGTKYAYLQSVGRGQEFVLDLDQYPGVTDWLMESIFTHLKK